MKEIHVKQCANGLLCSAVYDPKDDQVVIFSRPGGTALGYFDASKVSRLQQISYSDGFSDGYAACITDEDKYKWHDLRKNPDDLPEIQTVVLTYFANGEYTTNHITNSNVWVKGYYMYYEPVAWKYIEPFEEVKE